MLNAKRAKKMVVISFLAMAILIQASQISYADERGGRREGRDGHDGKSQYHTRQDTHQGREGNRKTYDYMRLIVKGLEYFYKEGRFHRKMAGQYVVVPAPHGAIVRTIPRGNQMVIINGTPYYPANGVIYVPSQSGYYEGVACTRG